MLNNISAFPILYGENVIAYITLGKRGYQNKNKKNVFISPGKRMLFVLMRNANPMRF